MPRLHTTQRRTITARGWQCRRTTKAFSRMALAFCGLVALLLSACANGAGTTPLAANQVFVWPYYTTNVQANSFQYDAVLDPAVLGYSYDLPDAAMLYLPLVTFDSGLNTVPDAATWDVSGNGTIYTFHLKQNLKFSDGTPLTAADYAYSIDRTLDSTLCTQDSQYSQCVPLGIAYLGAIIGASDRNKGTLSSTIAQGDDPRHGLNVLDQYTLRIRLSAPAAYFLDALATAVGFPVEQSLVKQYGNKWVDHLDKGGCSGPFMVKSYGAKGNQLTMVANPYWEAAFKKLTIQEVDRPYVSSQDAEYAAYRAGQYDYSEVPESQYTFARGEDDFNEVATLETQYIGLNLKVAPFDSLLVRQAFDLALNKQYLVDSTVHGAELPTDHIVPHGMPGFNDSLHNPAPDNTQSLTGNHAAATTLLKQAQSQCSVAAGATPPDYCPYITGSNPSPIVIVADSGNQSRVGIMQAAAQDWKSVLGLNVSVSQNDTAWTSCVGGPAPVSCQAWAVGWVADYPDPQDFLSLQFATGAPNNVESYSSSDLDTLFKQADAEQNQTLRLQDYNKAEQQLITDCPWIPYGQPKLFWRQRSWVHGFGLNALLTIADTDWAKVYITQH